MKLHHGADSGTVPIFEDDGPNKKEERRREWPGFGQRSQKSQLVTLWRERGEISLGIGRLNIIS